ncbi:MAG: TMEM165/GDT1 family protein [Myxococcaceae bacterium]
MPFDLGVFSTVFTVIFLAELPDKTALSTLVLATRYKPLPVFVGAGMALTLQSAVAVTAGGLLSLLPARPVHIGAGVLFLLSSLFMWRRRSPEADEAERLPVRQRTSGFLPALTSTFGVVFIAEWGDLTQLGTAALAARYRSPGVVFCSATLALWAVAGVAVLIGNRAGALMDPNLTKRIAAAAFFVIGIALVTGLL